MWMCLWVGMCERDCPARGIRSAWSCGYTWFWATWGRCGEAECRSRVHLYWCTVSPAHLMADLLMAREWKLEQKHTFLLELTVWWLRNIWCRHFHNALELCKGLEMGNKLSYCVKTVTESVTMSISCLAAGRNRVMFSQGFFSVAPLLDR